MFMKSKVNPIFNDMRMMSPKQAFLSMELIKYRMKYNLSQEKMAKICSEFGAPHGIKFAGSEIYNYENYKTIPRPNKFKILLNTLGLDEAVFA